MYRRHFRWQPPKSDGKQFFSEQLARLAADELTSPLGHALLGIENHQILKNLPVLTSVYLSGTKPYMEIEQC